MKILLILLLCSIIITSFITTLSVYGIPYTSPQERYSTSDVVLIGKIISLIPYSPTYTKYTIHVEQYLKNPQPQDELTIIAAGTKMENESGKTSQTIFNIGDRIFFYLHKDQGNYLVWEFSYPTNSLCDPEPTRQELDSERVQNMTSNFILHVEGAKSSTHFYVNQPVTMFYDAWNDHFITKTFDVEFNIKNGSDSKIVYNDTQKIELKPCIGHTIVHTSFIPHKIGRYEIEVNFDGSTMGTIVDIVNNSTQNQKEISPLKQYQSGVALADISCIKDFQLIFKAENSSPACVKSDTAQILLERGWAKNN